MSNINPRWGEWAKAPKPFVKEDFDETYTTEFLVIGQGFAVCQQHTVLLKKA